MANKQSRREWRTLVYNGKEFPGYEISNFGELKALKRVDVFNRQGTEVTRVYEERILNPSFLQGRKGYRKATIREDGKTYQIYIHRAVAFAFLDNPDNLPEVDHINGIEIDNSVFNLRWVSRSTNQRNRHQESAKHRGGYKVGEQYFRTLNEVAKHLNRSYGSVQQAAATGGKCNGERIIRVSWSVYNMNTRH